MTILGELILKDCSIELVRYAEAGTAFSGVFSGASNLLHMDIDYRNICRNGFPRFGRYTNESQEFSGIGPIVFRPAGFPVEARGFAPSHRLQCWLGDGPLNVVQDSVRRWDSGSLTRTLDIKAGSISLYMARLANEVARPGFASSVTADALLVLALNEIAGYVGGDRSAETRNAPGSGQHRDGDEAAVKRVVERICDMMDVTPTIDDLASLAGTSKVRLLRMFKEHAGTSLVAFIRRTRLEHALHYLALSDLSTTQIAERLGFSTQPNFSTAFRKEMRVTPRQYRRDHRPRVIGRQRQVSWSR